MQLACSFKCCEDFTIYEVSDRFYDLHNDFECVYIVLRDNNFSLRFQNVLYSLYVVLIFHDVEMKVFTFSCDNKGENLTLDLIYRGRCEKDGEIIEFFDEKGYFYINFLEGQKLEFWASSVSIHEE